MPRPFHTTAGIVAVAMLSLAPIPAPQAAVAVWGTYEVVVDGPRTGNPFLDDQIEGVFSDGARSVTVPGFYDGEGRYVIRMMPDRPGAWTYRTRSATPALDGRTGSFTAEPATAPNHGPVHVARMFHFDYADGTAFRPLGTTVYAWVHQPDVLQDQTLRTLAGAPFNKLRFTVFPKRYTWNTNEPPRYPFDGGPGHFDLTHFNVAFFRQLDRRILDLQRLGIEADLILFHPYDDGAWGFDRMTADQDDRYLRYVVARFAAYRNVWWSLANEYDFMTRKTEADWERIGALVSSRDPFHHLLSIHNGRLLFDQTRPWITHASIQNGAAVEDPAAAELYRDAFRKPIIYDEVKYEGDIPRRWGNLTAEELVFRFWNATVSGTYATHGETFLSPDDVLWWSKGGVLKGRSAPRLAFLQSVLDRSPPEGIDPIDKWQNPEYGGQPTKYYLVYLGKRTPASWPFAIPKPPQGPGLPPAAGMTFKAEVLDTWQMTVTEVPGTFTLKQRDDYFFADASGRAIALPGRPYMAIRITRVTP